ncbi:aldehyde dehydrogenase family protein [Arsenicicoccus piscis]|uniref:aldehyde dehydrogenase family protein n=1 Tax=Arsenicicoccus piscis TaxID=673954 RepID=UPI003B9874BF
MCNRGAVAVQELFIAGEWRAATSGRTREIHCPADGELVATVAEAGPDDALDAIAAARAAFDEGPWPSTPERERGDLLLRVADLLQRDKAEIARLESADTGKRYVESEYDVDDVTACFRYFGGIAGTDAGRVVDTGRSDAISRVVHLPVGVCTLITPWNYPLLQASWKVAPALLAGNTIVIKPSEISPSSTAHLVRLLQEAGLPDGVANLVLGSGAVLGETLTGDPRVDLVSFTGGLETGKRIMVSAAATVKRVALELGGKNPNVIFADADRAAAIDNALTAIFLHSGQVCSAGSRLIVEESAHDDIVDAIVASAKRIRIGGPYDEDAETGPLTSAEHLAKVEAYVARGLADGAQLRCGGRRPDGERYARGYYYEPTVLDGCTGTMSCVQDESFGPVLTVETFRTEAEAIAIANDTPYGLAGAVWTQDAGRAQRVAGALRHGTVWINDFHPYVPQAEWGGMGRSGIGRELGPHGLAEYQEIKHVWHNLEPAPTGWFSG